MTIPTRLVAAGGLLAAALAASACNPPGRRVPVADASAATKTYVAPGDKDEYYLFYSGGHSGQVYVYGVPSMRHISTIPVFTPYPATGYGFDDETKAMLGELDLGRRAPPRPLGDRRATTTGAGCSSTT